MRAAYLRRMKVKKLGWTKLFGDKFVTVRKIELSADDPKFKRVGELER